MSVALACGLHALGMLNATNEWLATALSRGGMETYGKQLPIWGVWLATAVFPVALAYAMLATPDPARRAILWITTVVVLGAWGPVLSLASHHPDIAGPVIATAWAGFCAMVHASKSHPGKPGPAKSR